MVSIAQLFEKEIFLYISSSSSSSSSSSVEDYERNDGSIEKPYFMSNKLKNLLGVKNKFNDRTDGTDGGQPLAGGEVSGGDKQEPVDSNL